MKKIYTVLLFLVVITSIAFAADYKRIVSLAPSITESLYELGIDEKVIGITMYCSPGKSKKEIIGTLLEPDLEKIVMLKPDLIISTKEGNNKAAVEKIQRLGFDVYTMESAGSFKDICENFKALAVKVGRKQKAEELIEKAEAEVREIYSNTLFLPRESVFWEVGAKPLYTAGKQSFVNDYNFYTATMNIYEDINMRYPSISREDVIERNPDIIILVNMGDISKDEIKNWEKYNTVTAVRNKRVYMIDVNDIFTPTPSTFAKAVKLLAKIIHPEIFNGKNK
ncbi:MAG: helical backbone metal receptor [Endomicrobia bacterium]|nr:helical backbone metal receptor [Endomicrobiia bacterium]